FLRTTYVATEIRAFDLAKPDGLVPLPPALFLALETNGSGCLPALVVDGKIRSEGWLPSPHDALRLIEHPDELASPATRPTVSEGCCSSDGCCSADSACC